MNHLRRVFQSLVVLAAANVWLLFMLLGGGLQSTIVCLLLLAAYLYINLRPVPRIAPTKRIHQLSAGCELLRRCLIATTVNAVWMLALLPSAIRDLNSAGFFSGLWMLMWIFNALAIVLMEAVVFWNGMIRVYLTSVQLGLKHRVLAAVCGWVPFLNIWYLTKIIRIASDEVEFETEKWELDETRAESEICKTKYPILMVHGVFFRDSATSTTGAAFLRNL